MIDKLLNCTQAAEFLCLKPATIRKLVFQRRIPFVKVGGTAVRLRESELAKLVKAGEVPALRPLK